MIKLNKINTMVTDKYSAEDIENGKPLENIVAVAKCKRQWATSKEQIALEAWNLIKKSNNESLTEEEHDELYRYLIVLMGDDSLYEALKQIL